jgi:hypothetical protein
MGRHLGANERRLSAPPSDAQFERPLGEESALALDNTIYVRTAWSRGQVGHTQRFTRAGQVFIQVATSNLLCYYSMPVKGQVVGTFTLSCKLREISAFGFALNGETPADSTGKAYSFSFMQPFEIGIVIHLRAETTVGLHLLCARAMCGAATARSLLSTATTNVRLPAAPGKLYLPTSARRLYLRASGSVLLLSTPSRQGAVASSLPETRGYPTIFCSQTSLNQRQPY